MRRVWLLAVLVSSFCAGTGLAGQLKEIRARGVLVVGTKGDYEPFGFMDAKGEIAGLEPDLAAEIAKRLGVALKIIPVTSANRLSELQAGNVDLIIATMGITNERRQQAGIIDPAYYAAVAGVLYENRLRIEEVRDLEGKTVCAVDGNIFLLELRTNYASVKTEVFKDLVSAEEGPFGGRCEALFFDDLALLAQKKSHPGRYKNFEFQQLIEIDPLLLGMAVRRGEEKAALGAFISKLILEWHRSGFLLGVEKKWLGSNTILLQSLKQKFTARATKLTVSRCGTR